MSHYTIIEEKRNKTTVEMDSVVFQKFQKIMDNDFSYFESQELSPQEKKALENITHFDDFNKAFNQIKI